MAILFHALPHSFLPGRHPFVNCQAYLPAMPTFTTDADSTHPSLPPIQSPTTDSSPPDSDDEEVVMVDVVSLASTTTKNPCTPPVYVSTNAATGKDTEVSNIV